MEKICHFYPLSDFTKSFCLMVATKKTAVEIYRFRFEKLEVAMPGKTQAPIEKNILEKCVLVVDDSLPYCKLVKRKLEEAGFKNVNFACNAVSTVAFLEENHCDLLLLDICLGDNGDEGFELLELIRSRGYGGKIVMVSSFPSHAFLARAAILGANDFLVKNLELDIIEETFRLLQKKNCMKKSRIGFDVFDRIGFFRSMGLTRSDIELLKEYSDGFPHYRELAERLGRPDIQIRKRFSDIYRKIDENFDIGNPAQLSALITTCLFFE